MADTPDTSSFTLDDAKKALASYKSASTPSDTSDTSAAPKTVLSGHIEYTPEMEKTAAQQVQPERPDLFMVPIEEANRGVMSVPEDVADYALGAAQSMAKVPPKQQMTAGDLLRKVNPGIVLPNEIPQSQAYKRLMQRAPILNTVAPVANAAGSFAFPLGEIEQAITKLPLATRLAQQGTQMFARLGKLGSEVPIAQNAAQTIAKLNQLARLSTAQRVGQVLHPVAAGAAYAPVFAGGRQFGQTRTMPTPNQALSQAAGGGVLGAGAGGVMAALNRMKMNAAIRQLSQLSPMAEQPAPAAATQSALKEVIPPAPVVGQRLQGLVARNLARPDSNAAQKRIAIDHLLRASERKYGANSEEHLLEVAKARRNYEQAGLRETSQAERRDYQQQRQTQTREYQQQQRDQKIQRTTQHTQVSGVRYRELADRVDAVGTKDELQDLRRDILDQGPGPEGRPLLTEPQRSDLMREWRRARARLYKEEGAAPGESPGPTEGSQPSPGEQREPDREQKLLSGEQKQPIRERSEPKKGSVSEHIVGSYRKTFDVKRRGNRENRYKGAVSIDRLAEEAGLEQHKTTALKQWVSDMAEVRRELTYAEEKATELLRWADKNESNWISSLKTKDVPRLQKYRRQAQKVQMETTWQDAVEKDLETTERKNRPVVESKPHVEVTTNGIVRAGAHQEGKAGQLDVKGALDKIKLPEFTPPKDAKELFDRLDDLAEWRSHFQSELRDIKNAKVTYRKKTIDGKLVDTDEILNSFDHLGDGTTPADVMGEIWDKLRLPYVEGKAPDTVVWHIDKANHVSTVSFKQGRSPGNVSDESIANAQAIVDKFRDKVTGKIDMDALQANQEAMSKLRIYLPGLEFGLLPTLFGKQLNKAGRFVFKKAEIITAGTVDDILRDHPRFGGQELSDGLHQMLGEISANFLKDTAGEWYPVKSAEDLAELLNEFKGAKVTRSDYRNRASEILDEKAKKSGTPATDADAQEALKKADTAFMIRSKYNAFAKKVDEVLDEMNIRRKDAKSGQVSDEGRKYYTEGLDTDERGFVRRNAHDDLYHEAVQQLSDALHLRPGTEGFAAKVFNGFASRVNQSIMTNKPTTTLKNFFDQAPLTLAYFGQHFIQAAVDIHSNPELQAAIERMPVIPQAEMSLVKLEEKLNDPREDTTAGEKLDRFGAKLDHFLGVKLDVFFKGHAPLVSLADRAYAKYSILASFYKSAAERGVDRVQFVDDLINGRLPQETESAVMQEMSLALSQTLNTVAPNLNRNLYASSPIGRATGAYSTPGARMMKMWVNWAKSDNPIDKLRLIGSFSGMVAFGGRGAVPASLLGAYAFMAAMSGNSETAERNLQGLDQLNVLRRTLGIDWSPSFGPDWANNAQPALDALQKAPERARQIAMQSHNWVDAAWNTTEAVGLEGLHLIPKVGPLGMDSWVSLMKDLGAAQQGVKFQYFQLNGGLQRVPIQNYSYNDAIRDWLIGGISPKAQDAVQERKLELAKRDDAKYRAYKSIIPEKEAASPLRDVLTGNSPGITKE